CDSERDLEKPSAGAMPSIDEVLEATMRDHEDLLRLVIGLRERNAETPKVAPDEVDVSLVHRAERLGARRVVRDRGERRPRRDLHVLRKIGQLGRRCGAHRSLQVRPTSRRAYTSSGCTAPLSDESKSFGRIRFTPTSPRTSAARSLANSPRMA